MRHCFAILLYLTLIGNAFCRNSASQPVSISELCPIPKSGEPWIELDCLPSNRANIELRIDGLKRNLVFESTNRFAIARLPKLPKVCKIEIYYSGALEERYFIGSKGNSSESGVVVFAEWATPRQLFPSTTTQLLHVGESVGLHPSGKRGFIFKEKDTSPGARNPNVNYPLK
jgi:hypothetical protein